MILLNVVVIFEDLFGKHVTRFMRVSQVRHEFRLVQQLPADVRAGGEAGPVVGLPVRHGLRLFPEERERVAQLPVRGPGRAVRPGARVAGRQRTGRRPVAGLRARVAAQERHRVRQRPGVPRPGRRAVHAGRRPRGTVADWARHQRRAVTADARRPLTGVAER